MSREYKKQVSYQEHLEPLLSYAKSNKMNKAALCKAAGVAPKRWSDFVEGRKAFTVYYFYKFLGGLALTEKSYQKVTGAKLTEAQIEMLRFQKWKEAQEPLLLKMMRHSNLLEDAKLLAQKYED